jgi:hypothetical protein
MFTPGIGEYDSTFGLFLQSAVVVDDKRVGERPIAPLADPRIVRLVYCLHGGPVKSLLDPSFKYVPSVETDIRKTFARVRREARRQPPVLSTNDKSSKIAVLFGDKSFANKKRAL